MRDFPVAQMMKNLPAMQNTQVGSLGSEDLPEKEMTTHSSIFAWRIPWTEEPGGLQSVGLEESDTAKQLTLLLLYMYDDWLLTKVQLPNNG